ncbi:MAG: hypothetical protein K6T85_12875 [Gorillibacterium sp.]|nr:hypothetical protein [Gorillibacterium sp.]
MDEMYNLCMRHMRCNVRVHTCYGQCYEGVIVNVDSDNVYLRPLGGASISGKASISDNKAQTSGWYGFGYGDEILTLSLFTLLALFLI